MIELWKLQKSKHSIANEFQKKIQHDADLNRSIDPILGLRNPTMPGPGQPPTPISKENRDSNSLKSTKGKFISGGIQQTAKPDVDPNSVIENNFAMFFPDMRRSDIYNADNNTANDPENNVIVKKKRGNYYKDLGEPDDSWGKVVNLHNEKLPSVDSPVSDERGKSPEARNKNIGDFKKAFFKDFPDESEREVGG
jgi:hypothetical protein